MVHWNDNEKDEKECLDEVAEEENNCIGKDHEKIED